MTSSTTPLTFAYYCSGHGYGHATRVSAVATYLRRTSNAPRVYIISSAPKDVFDLAISAGALYRYAEIDPIIVQPLAYYVDRRKSVEVLKIFLAKQDEKIVEEVAWLMDNDVDCVLSDAAFLACKAANSACIPSVLITNFTFDSVYSYLSIRFPDNSSLNPNSAPPNPDVTPLGDEPIPPEELALLVKELHDGYRCAELLLRLPGNIPLPSFGIEPSLPSYMWTDPERNTFIPEVSASLSRNPSSECLLPSMPFSSMEHSKVPKPLPRRVVQAPLIVRHPSPDIYTPDGRKHLLDYIGIPEFLQTTHTKILVVSFGGQVFRRPRSRSTSRSQSPTHAHRGDRDVSHTPSSESISSTSSLPCTGCLSPPHRKKRNEAFVHVVPPIVTDSHLWVPGAPPANKTPTIGSAAQLQNPPHNPGGYEGATSNALVTPVTNSGSNYFDSDAEAEHWFLPDDSWIAIVCGVTAPAKGTADEDNELPANFFIAPRDVYMPDLTAIADVLLGKLGYGTTAECVDACTPFVFVPRPLFVEEHGLRLLLDNEGVGVELSREKYEAGDWADAISTAYRNGKGQKRALDTVPSRRQQGERMAQQLVDWVREWQHVEETLRDTASRNSADDLAVDCLNADKREDFCKSCEAAHLTGQFA